MDICVGESCVPQKKKCVCVWVLSDVCLFVVGSVLLKKSKFGAF